jgi:serine carboxypeptidase-like clade 2
VYIYDRLHPKQCELQSSAYLKDFSNVLYLEQPAFVGFSYSDVESDKNTNDWKAAADNFQFLELWLQEFPLYKGRQTWLVGESYAGVYIPTLTSLILNHTNSIINQQLVGLAVGNPVFR